MAVVPVVVVRPVPPSLHHVIRLVVVVVRSVIIVVVASVVVRPVIIIVRPVIIIMIIIRPAIGCYCHNPH